MVHTEYTFLTNDEIIQFVTCGDNRTALEVELAQRLTVAIDANEGERYGNDARG